jgi:hypothetical protein
MQFLVPVVQTKELSTMSRLFSAAVSFFVTLAVFGSVASAEAAPSPWWQVLTGSHPTNLWEPQSEVQEVEAPSTPFVLTVGGNFAGLFNLPPTFPEGTAENIQTALEGAYGPGSVEVTGGPAGGAPFIVTSIGEDAGKAVPPIGIGPTGSAKVVQEGGSGRLVLTVTNLGDAAVDATGTSVTIRDELPEGMVATGVDIVAGVPGKYGPASCLIEAEDLVNCTVEGELPPFEAIEVEISVSLTGNPPMAAAPGRVTVAGGNVAPVETSQDVKVSPEPTKFGIERFSVRSEEEGGAPTLHAGAHPFQLTTTIQLNSGRLHLPNGSRAKASIDQPALPKNFRFRLPVGLIGNASSLPQCPMASFFEAELSRSCGPETAVGNASVTFIEQGVFGLARLAVPLFNLPPAPGEPARFGMVVSEAPVVIDTEVDPDDQYRIIAKVNNASQVVDLLSSTVTLWGTPDDPRHDSSRGWNCGYHFTEVGPCEALAVRGTGAFLRQPVSCVTSMDSTVELEPWNSAPGAAVERASTTSSKMVGCNQVPFDPQVSVAPTSSATEAPSGLEYRVDMPNAGLKNGEAIAEGQAKKVEVTLPEGVTINPSQTDGLEACTPQDYARETFDSAPGDGCPLASKIGEVQVSTPLLKEEAKGAVYVASPFDNPFNSLVALYIVAKIPERGILIKQAGSAELNPQTGQIVTTFDDLPQIPFSTFRLRFREGPRAPLVMPAACGDYDITTRFTPWNAADPDNPQPSEIITRTTSFRVSHGADGGACPSGTPPFKPGFTAGTENNAAGKYSPLDVRLTRQDGEQEFKTFSLKMPEGVIGKLAGIPFCSDAAIAAARNRTGPKGGQEELDHSSCPVASQIGTTLVGAGVGPTLTYAPGKLYLAGRYKGSKLSVVAITTAKVGPFDLGNVVIRQGLKVDPDTAQVSTDGASADPIPHILQGIVVHARDIRINVDRKDFILNPTSCERMKAAASVLGSGNTTADVSSPFQAADCARLGFKPKLSLSLKGGTRRGAHPRLKAVLKARKGDANIGAAVVKLPHSEFLEQGHIRTICTRVQFAAGDGNGSRCPKGSVYGRARAISPLLDEPLVGPVYLRSSNHALPDLVAALHSKKVDINLDGRIDAVNGGIRNSFEAVPDAPVTKFVLEMQGGRKGLLVNSTNICQGKHRARASFTGQNGKLHAFNPLLKARCGGKHGRRSKH